MHIPAVSILVVYMCSYVMTDFALEKVNLECLVERRETLCLKFARATLKNQHMKHMFPPNDVVYPLDTRGREQFRVTMAHTERLKRSSIPYMQRLPNLNDWEERIVCCFIGKNMACQAKSGQSHRSLYLSIFMLAVNYYLYYITCLWINSLSLSLSVHSLWVTDTPD